MPGFDRTGPLGEGPRTGRAQGKCANKKSDNDLSQSGQGFGRGRCNGRGKGRRFEDDSRGLGRGFGNRRSRNQADS